MDTFFQSDFDRISRSSDLVYGSSHKTNHRNQNCEFKGCYSLRQLSSVAERAFEEDHCEPIDIQHQKVTIRNIKAFDVTEYGIPLLDRHLTRN